MYFRRLATRERPGVSLALPKGASWLSRCRGAPQTSRLKIIIKASAGVALAGMAGIGDGRRVWRAAATRNRGIGKRRGEGSRRDADRAGAYGSDTGWRRLWGCLYHVSVWPTDEP
jgi:hypothetical protein